MSHTLQIRLAPASDAMEAYLERFRPWVEELIGCPLSSTVRFELQYPFSHVVLEDLLPTVPLDRQCLSAAPILRELVDRWALPPGISPRIELNPSRDRSRGITSAQPAWDPHWKETPIALWLRGLEHPVVFADIPYVSYNCASPSSAWREWMVVRRDESAECLARLPHLRHLRPRQITVIGGQPTSLPEARYDWDAVVLDPSLNDLIRADYETFWESEDWFRKRHLPYRRGYLLYGPPGNGKSTVARIMACHPLVTPFSIDFGEEHLPNSSLTQLFQNAADSAPAVIIFEDLDRVFGADPSSNRSAITISHLLNCLDGLGTRDGVVVVATANDPVDLDPALLKRPGRFDRLVAFPPPSPATRVEYLRRLLGGQPEQGFLAAARDESDRLSFAQIREAYILAGQSALRRRRDIELEDLLDGLRRVRGEANCVRSKADGTAVGFGTTLAARPAETELVSRRP
jgi:hypothetical protein